MATAVSKSHLSWKDFIWTRPSKLMSRLKAELGDVEASRMMHDGGNSLAGVMGPRIIIVLLGFLGASIASTIFAAHMGLEKHFLEYIINATLAWVAFSFG